MPRTVKPHEHTAKRNEILAAAQRLMFTKGYERMSIQDILDTLAISKGAFYHYFDSKAALLEATIEQGQDELDLSLRAIVAEPGPSALQKFQSFFAAVDSVRAEHQATIIGVLPVWFADDNAIVREKSDQAIVQRRAPLLNAIVRQGVQEGLFTTPYPEQAGPILLAITRGVGNVILKLILAFQQDHDEPRAAAEIVAASAAAAEAIERVLGASAPIVNRPDAQTVRGWLAALSRAAEPAP
jgi:AcrR family transcriptional regulator